MNERLDALLSARRDGVLETSERAELERLLATHAAARDRAAAFERVDEALRSLAAQPVADARLARNLARLEERSGSESSSGTASPVVGRGRVLDIRDRDRDRYGYGMAAAAVGVAAVWIGMLVLAPTGVQMETEMVIGEPPDAAREAISTEDLAGLGIDQVGDLEVIEELELLEFLAARERSEEGPRG